MRAAMGWLVVRLTEQLVDFAIAHCGDLPFFLIRWLPIFHAFGEILLEGERHWVGVQMD